MTKWKILSGTAFGALALMAAPAMAQDAFGGWDPQPTPTPEPVPVPRPVVPRQLSPNEQSYCNVASGIGAVGAAVALFETAIIAGVVGVITNEALQRECADNMRESSPDRPNFYYGY